METDPRSRSGDRNIPPEGLKHLSQEELDQLLQEALPIALQIAIEPNAGTIPTYQGGPDLTTMPIAFVETDRPDIRDLSRIHQLEGEGAVATRWLYLLSHNPALILLEATLSSPVAKRFVLKFELPRAKDFLWLLSQVGIVYLSTDLATAQALRQGSPTALDTMFEKGEGFMCEVSNGQELRQALMAWARRTGK